MLRPFCFPKRFKNLSFFRDCTHVPVMLHPCCYPKGSRSAVLLLVVNKEHTYKNLVIARVLLHVAFMLRPCFFPKRRNNLVFPNSCFPRFGRMLLSSASLLLSKTFQGPGVFLGFCARCVHVASMLLSKTCQAPGVCPGFCACCLHVASLSLMLGGTFQ